MNHGVRIGRTVNLRENVADTGELEDSARSGTGDNASTGSGRHQEQVSRTELHFDVVRNRSIENNNVDQIVLSGFSALADSFGEVLSLAETDTDLAFLITDNDASAEGKATATLHNFRATVDVHDSVFEFRDLSLSFAFQSVPLRGKQLARPVRGINIIGGKKV